MDIIEIKKQLTQRAEEVARYLLPNGKRHGAEWKIGNVKGEKGNSLGIHLQGIKKGIWKDFATGQGGDLIDLWSAVRGIDLAMTLTETKTYLGYVEPKFIIKQKNYKRPTKPPCKAPTNESSVFNYFTKERKLSEDTLKAYKIAEKRTDKNNLIVFPFIRNNELIHIKYLAVERDEKGKKITWSEKDTELCLFGWQVIDPNTRSVIITEGELDAMSWYEYGFAAMSVPNGAKGHSWIENEFNNLDRFETIYLSFDMDDEGKIGVVEVVERLGRHRVRIVKLPCKDANECLKTGITKEKMVECLENSIYSDPSELKSPSAYVDEVIAEFYPTSQEQKGFTPLWRKLAGKIHFRPGELSIWTGFNSHGKTTFLSQVILAGVLEGEKICVVSLEAKPAITLKKLTRQATGQECPSPSYIRKCHDWYDGKLWVYDWTTSADINKILSVWEYARARYGVTQFVLDNLTRCGVDEHDRAKQQTIINLLASFAANTKLES